MCREPVISADRFCKPVDIRRLPGRAPSTMVLSNKSMPNRPSRDHRGWSPHMTASRDTPAKPNQAPNENFLTSGEIGTNAMHTPGKRSIESTIKAV